MPFTIEKPITFALGVFIHKKIFRCSPKQEEEIVSETKEDSGTIKTTFIASAGEVFDDDSSDAERYMRGE